MIGFETASGAVYHVDRGRMRRVNNADMMRADSEWLTVYRMFPDVPTVGERVTFVLEPLAKYGPDSYGNEDADAVSTTRVTTPVVSVWGDIPRPEHNHITQAEQPVTGCLACKLIRPEVMTLTALRILRNPGTAHVFGPVPQHA